MDFRIVLDGLMKGLMCWDRVGQLLSGGGGSLEPLGACGPKSPVAGNVSAHPAAFWKTFWLLALTPPPPAF